MSCAAAKAKLKKLLPHGEHALRTETNGRVFP